jgi:hypothetical protein
MNAATGSNRRLRDTGFRNFICSIRHRLLRLQSTLDGILGGCLRLAMLVFLATTFPVSGTKVRYPYLASRFRECCRAVEAATPQLQDLMLWLLTVGATSIYGVDEPSTGKRTCRAWCGPRRRSAAAAVGDYVDRHDSRRAREICV